MIAPGAARRGRTLVNALLLLALTAPAVCVTLPPAMTAPAASAQEGAGYFDIRLPRLEYGGGGDWYGNPSSLPNLARYITAHTTLRADPEPVSVEPGSPELFRYPVVYMNGHGNVRFTDREVENLRRWLLGGGFLFADDNYGMDASFRREMARVLPGHPLVELPFTHPVYAGPFPFPEGLPKVHEHDGGPPHGWGILAEGRLVVFYSQNTDLGDGWEDPAVHGDPPQVREAALRMGTNIVLYALTH